jgi:hypothetical protein
MKLLKLQGGSIGNKMYVGVLFALLGVTKAVGSVEFTLPGKYHNLLDSIRASSNAAHARIAAADQDIAKKYDMIEANLKQEVIS